MDRDNLKGIFALFESGIASGLKFPKVRVQTSEGGPVVLKLAGSKSRHPGCIMVTNGGTYGTESNVYYGRIAQDGALYPSKEIQWDVLNVLRELANDPAETAARYGKLTGNCSFCDTALTDSRSTAVGYGPVCAKHYNLPWGTDFRANTPALTVSILPHSQASRARPVSRGEIGSPIHTMRPRWRARL